MYSHTEPVYSHSVLMHSCCTLPYTFMQALLMFKHLSDEDCHHALHQLCIITSALHDIMQYLCAHSKLGSGQALLGSRKIEFVSADWGGTEGIGQYHFSPWIFCSILGSSGDKVACPLYVFSSIQINYMATLTKTMLAMQRPHQRLKCYYSSQQGSA